MAFNYQLVRLGIPPKVLKRRYPVKYTLTVAKEDDPIFKQPFAITKTNLDKVKLVKLTNSMNTDEKEKLLSKALIRQGWKLVEDE